jgi:hypothetical protein
MHPNSLKWAFDQQKLGPNKVAHRANGTMSFSWHVDDNDDRFVGVSSSVRSEDFMVLMRDETKAEVAVLRDVEEIVNWVKSRLNRLRRHGSLG